MAQDIRVTTSASYDHEPYLEDSIIIGGINVLNAFMPLVVYAWLIQPYYGSITKNKIYLYAWYGLQAGHMLAYSIPALIWPFIYVKSNTFMRALFSFTWYYFSQTVGIVTFSYTLAALLAASYSYNKISDRDDYGELTLQITDIWCTEVLYLFTQILVFYTARGYGPGAMKYVGFDPENGHEFDWDDVI